MRTKEETNKLVEDNIKLVGYVLIKYYRWFKSEYPNLADDLYQEGCIGLCKTAKRYDSSKGEFSTIAITNIKYYMSDFIKRYVRRHYRTNIDSFEKIILSGDSDSEIKLIDITPTGSEIKDLRLYKLDRLAIESNIKDLDKIIYMLKLDYRKTEIARELGVTTEAIQRKIRDFKYKLILIEKLFNMLNEDRAS